MDAFCGFNSGHRCNVDCVPEPQYSAWWLSKRLGGVFGIYCFLCWCNVVSGVLVVVPHVFMPLQENFISVQQVSDVLVLVCYRENLFSKSQILIMHNLKQIFSPVFVNKQKPALLLQRKDYDTFSVRILNFLANMAVE